MRRGTVVLAAFLVLVGYVVKVRCEQRAQDYNYQAAQVFTDGGNARNGISVQVGTTTPVQVYNPQAPKVINYDSPDRMVVIQNDTAFTLWCGTFSAVSATTGPRWAIFGSTVSTTSWPPVFQTYSTSPIWCIFASNAGAGTKEVNGYVEYDSRD